MTGKKQSTQHVDLRVRLETQESYVLQDGSVTLMLSR